MSTQLNEICREVKVRVQTKNVFYFKLLRLMLSGMISKLLKVLMKGLPVFPVRLSLNREHRGWVYGFED